MTLLTGVLLLFTGCKDNDDNTATDSERLFMPMFRVQANTNNSSDRYACSIASAATDCSSNHVNDVMLYWYGVDGASGYRIKSKIQGTDWEKNSVLDTIVSPERLRCYIPTSSTPPVTAMPFRPFRPKAKPTTPNGTDTVTDHTKTTI